MTQTTDTAKVKTAKQHPGGGTYTEHAFAYTRDRWGISITRRITYRNEVLFEVHRVSADNKTFCLDRFRIAANQTEAEAEAQARAFANKMWLKEKR